VGGGRCCEAPKMLWCRGGSIPFPSRLGLLEEHRRLPQHCLGWSPSRNWIRLSRPLCTLTFCRQCHPSTSLLVLTGCRKTDHVEGGQTVESTHVWRMYSKCCATCGWLFAATISCRARRMAAADRNGDVIVFEQTRLMFSSLLFSTCSPTAWTFRFLTQWRHSKLF